MSDCETWQSYQQICERHYNGMIVEFGHPYKGSVTCWLANRQDKDPIEERIIIAPIKKIVTSIALPSVDMLWFHTYHQVRKHCPYPNYDVIPISQKLENNRHLWFWVDMCELSWGQITIWQYLTHMRNVTPIEHCVWIDKYYLSLGTMQKKQLHVVNPRCFKAVW